MKRLLLCTATLALILVAMIYFTMVIPALLNAGEIGFLIGIVAGIAGAAGTLFLSGKLMTSLTAD